MVPAIDSLRSAGWTEEIIREYVEQDAGHTDKPLVSIRGGSKNFGRTSILTKVDFDVYKGEIFGVIGRSGAGKTTLIHLLAGLENLDKGKVTVPRDSIGLSSQEPSFYPQLSVAENIRFFGKLVSAKKTQVKSLIDELGLKPYLGYVASTLSGGIQKKLDMCIAFLGSPSLVLLDEPTADLDPISRRDIWSFLKNHSSDKTIIVASHQLEELEPLCDRVAILNNGRIVALGTADQFRERIGARYIVRLEFESRDYSAFEGKHPGWSDGSGLIVTANTQKEVFSLLQDVLSSGESIVSASVEHPSLRHLFSTIVQ